MRTLASLALLGLVACASSTPEPRRPGGAAPGRCDVFNSCPAGQRCVTGSCMPVDCRAKVVCAELGLCSMGDSVCVAATDDDCRASAACRRLGLCRAVAGTCAAETPPGCAHPGPCDPSGLCVCPLQRSLGRPPEGPPAISPEAVSQAIREGIDQVKACYERAARKQPGLTGTLVLDFTIGSDGTVTRAGCSSITAPSVDLALCVLAQIRTTRVRRRPGEPVEVSYPVTFRSRP